MGYPKDLKNCRVLIKDIASGELLADTQITDYDCRAQVLRIQQSGLRVKYEELQGGPVTALVFFQNMLYEYRGVLRKALTAGKIQISLFGGKEYENRQKYRYDMQMTGRIEGIIFGGQKVMLKEPIEVVSKNISGNGILMQAMAGSLEKGDYAEIFLDLKGTYVRGIYEVMRIQNQTLWTEEYGCRNILMIRER